jgi:hypothetical protein
MPRAGVSVGRTERSAAAPSGDERGHEGPPQTTARHLRAVPDRLDPEILEQWERKVSNDAAREARVDRARRSNPPLDAPLQRTSRSLPADAPPQRGARTLEGGVGGRRTVTIQGRGTERGLPRSSRRPQRPIHERNGFRPDKTALYAVLLGLFLVFAAAMSARAAVRPAPPRPAIAHELVLTSSGDPARQLTQHYRGRPRGRPRERSTPRTTPHSASSRWRVGRFARIASTLAQSRRGRRRLGCYRR